MTFTGPRAAAICGLLGLRLVRRPPSRRWSSPSRRVPGGMPDNPWSTVVRSTAGPLDDLVARRDRVRPFREEFELWRPHASGKLGSMKLHVDGPCTEGES